MTWIKTITPDQANPDLLAVYQSIRALYPPEYGGEPVPALLRPDGRCDSIVAAHSLMPAAMQHMMSGLAVMFQPHLPLTRQQQEMIAAVVSITNQCFY